MSSNKKMNNRQKKNTARNDDDDDNEYQAMYSPQRNTNRRNDEETVEDRAHRAYFSYRFQNRRLYEENDYDEDYERHMFVQNFIAQEYERERRARALDKEMEEQEKEERELRERLEALRLYEDGVDKARDAVMKFLTEHPEHIDEKKESQKSKAAVSVVASAAVPVVASAAVVSAVVVPAVPVVASAAVASAEKSASSENQQTEETPVKRKSIPVYHAMDNQIKFYSSKHATKLMKKQYKTEKEKNSRIYPFGDSEGAILFDGSNGDSKIMYDSLGLIYQPPTDDQWNFLKKNKKIFEQIINIVAGAKSKSLLRACVSYYFFNQEEIKTEKTQTLRLILNGMPYVGLKNYYENLAILLSNENNKGDWGEIFSEIVWNPYSVNEVFSDLKKGMNIKLQFCLLERCFANESFLKNVEMNVLLDYLKNFEKENGKDFFSYLVKKIHITTFRFGNKFSDKLGRALSGL